jgi:hypothetical protein
MGRMLHNLPVCMRLMMGGFARREYWDGLHISWCVVEVGSTSSYSPILGSEIMLNRQDCRDRVVTFHLFWGWLRQRVISWARRCFYCQYHQDRQRCLPQSCSRARDKFRVDWIGRSQGECVIRSAPGVRHYERTHGVSLHTSSVRKGPWRQTPGCVREVVVPFADMAAGGCSAFVGCGRTGEITIFCPGSFRAPHYLCWMRLVTTRSTTVFATLDHDDAKFLEKWVSRCVGGTPWLQKAEQNRVFDLFRESGSTCNFMVIPQPSIRGSAWFSGALSRALLLEELLDDHLLEFKTLKWPWNEADERKGYHQ